MKPGAKPSPTRIKRLRGNPGRRPLNDKEPQPAKSKGIPRAPAYLSKTAQKEWRRTARQLHKAGLLTELDRTALAGYCRSFATWVDAMANLDKHGTLIKSKSGFPMQSPYLTIANKAMAEMRKWLCEFGMTPSSRTRLTVDEPKKQDPAAEFLARGGKPYAVKK